MTLDREITTLRPWRMCPNRCVIPALATALATLILLSGCTASSRWAAQARRSSPIGTDPMPSARGPSGDRSLQPSQSIASLRPVSGLSDLVRVPGRAVSLADCIAAESGFRLSSEDLLDASVETEQPVTLESLIAQAMATHPKILAARQDLAAMSHRIPQAAALDDPLFGNTFWPIHDQALQTAGGRMGHQFALSQKIPWPAKLNAREAVACREVQMARAEVAKAEQEIIEAVRLAYYELWLSDELIRIVGDSLELVHDLLTVTEARYKAGGSQQDVLRAELEGDKLDDQLIQLHLKKEQARADLGALLRQPVYLMPTAFGELNVAEVSPELESLVAYVEQCNPSLRGLSAEVARDRAKQSLACLQKYPDLQLGLGYSIISDDSTVISPVADGHDNINFTVGVTLPIWRDKIDAGVREAGHRRNATINRMAAERDRLRGQLRRQIASAYASIEQLELFRDRLVPRTEQTLQIATADYQGKRADFTDLVDIYRELLAYQVQLARSKATLASALAQIERTVGCYVDPLAELNEFASPD